MKEKKEEEEELVERLLDLGWVTESIDTVIDRLLDKSDKRRRRYTLG